MGVRSPSRLEVKGRQGEERVMKALIDLGAKVIDVSGKTRFDYRGVQFGPHDVLFIYRQNTFLAQVKNKNPKTKYHDTGLEKRKWLALVSLQASIPWKVLLIFTDNSHAIYGGTLSYLDDKFHEEPNYTDDSIMVYWYVSQLKPLKQLLQEETSKQLTLARSEIP